MYFYSGKVTIIDFRFLPLSDSQAFLRNFSKAEMAPQLSGSFVTHFAYMKDLHYYSSSFFFFFVGKSENPLWISKTGTNVGLLKSDVT